MGKEKYTKYLYEYDYMQVHSPRTVCNEYIPSVMKKKYGMHYTKEKHTYLILSIYRSL